MIRHSTGALLAFAGSLLAASAGGQEIDELSGTTRSRDYVDSPQDIAVELRFGRYVPNADDGLGSTPYEDIFGNDNRYYGGFEIDWQVLRVPYLGSFGPGFGIGYTKSSAKAPFESAEGRSGQDTSLEILPMYLVGVLRADVLARETLVPLVPYGKLGLGFALWQAKEAEDTARDGGVVGRGLSYGPQFALGIMFMLDVLDREDARTADANIGLNHSYLFAEWYVSDLDGFGASDRLQVGTNTWMVGIALEF